MFTSIAIIGRPNVGKSSLFNKLTKSRDAVVSDFPGLTKDRNYGFIKLKNRDTLLVDTGGIANKKETIKEAISQQAWLAVEESSLIILLLDSSEDLNKEDLDIIYKLISLFFGPGRISDQVESEGMDMAYHGERGFDISD